MPVTLQPGLSASAAAAPRRLVIGAPAEASTGLGDIAAALENAFERAIPEWWTLARELKQDPGADFSHAASCAPNASDLGLMLAWSRLVADYAEAPETTLVCCDDPWLYRHLAELEGVGAAPAPGLARREFGLGLRGALARTARVPRLAAAAIGCRRQRRSYRAGASAILVYAHPASATDGRDAYFGALMAALPELHRVLHTDPGPAGAPALADGRRTFSLNAWGAPLAALRFAVTRWRPGPARLDGPYGWLIRRAAVIEGATAQAMMVRWQDHCQRRWLAAATPRAVAWPWENHGWERLLARAARSAGVRSLGYQHSVVGRHAANHAMHSEPDPAAATPDRILCNGPAGMEQLVRFGLPAERLTIAGTLRGFAINPIAFDPAAPVFVALPMMAPIAREMLAALEQVSDPALTFVLKAHPMTTLEFRQSARMQKTDTPLGDFERLRTVLYSATTVGLEGLIAGLPTLRFMPASTIAIDILSPPAEAVAVTRETLAEKLRDAVPPAGIPARQFFAPFDAEAWRHALATT